MPRFCLIGPTYPYRGGIAHYTTLLAQHLRQNYETLLISFTRQYPSWLFPGRSDRDPSQQPLRTPAEYLLDPLNPFSWRQTIRRTAEWSPDVVVIPWWVPFWAPAWAVIGRGVKRLESEPKLIFICHNVLPHENSPFDHLALRLALHSGDGYIVHSTGDEERLLGQFPGANVQLTPLPTYGSLGQGSPASLPISLDDDTPLLIFFGFVRRYKGLDILLDALPMVGRTIRLLVVGEFWEDEARYRHQIEQLNLQDQVTVVNEYVPDEQLAAYVAAADAAVLPYRSATQSAVIQLAFGQGTPVITTDVGGLAEAVQDGRTGLVVPPEDPQALAAAIDRFFDEDMESKFKSNIRIEQGQFSWNVLIEKLLLLSGEIAPA